MLRKNHDAKVIGENIQIAFKQPKNLQKIVSGTKKNCRHEIEPNPGCFKCGKCSVLCPVLKEGVSFSSRNTKKSYKIKKKLNCNSSFVIYLVTCKKCGGQYVGKSQTPIKTRHSNHKREIKNLIGGLGKHYGGELGCGYGNFSIQLIDQVEMGEKEKLAQKEIFWQHQLRAYCENGGNAHCIRKDLY